MRKLCGLPIGPNRPVHQRFRRSAPASGRTVSAASVTSATATTAASVTSASATAAAWRMACVRASISD